MSESQRAKVRDAERRFRICTRFAQRGEMIYIPSMGCSWRAWPCTVSNEGCLAQPTPTTTLQRRGPRDLVTWPRVVRREQLSGESNTTGTADP